MNIYERMKIARKKEGLSQREVAEKLKMTSQQYSLYETGKREMPLSKVQQFLDIVGCDANYLFGIEVKVVDSEKK